MKVVFALGSNLGDSYSTLESAIEELNHIITVTDASSFIETEPVGGPEQPNYVNAVVIGESEKEPMVLLREALAIENKFGRVREVRWGPRTLDIDLIIAGDHIIESPELELPHPRAHERAFVLEPWCEIDPDAVIPGRGAIQVLLAELHRAE